MSVEQRAGDLSQARRDLADNRMATNLLRRFLPIAPELFDFSAPMKVLEQERNQLQKQVGDSVSQNPPTLKP